MPAILVMACLQPGDTPPGQPATTRSSFDYTLNAAGWRHAVEQTPDATIELTYPDRIPLGPRPNAEAMATIESRLQDIVRGFTESAAGYPRIDARPYSLAVEGREYRSGRTVSYAFTIHTDMHGAHPNTTYETIVLDEEGQVVPVASLVDGPGDLAWLAAEARRQVEAQLRNRMGEAHGPSAIFEAGLAPVMENFSRAVLDSGHLRIFIPPYQAAAYAAGPFEVVVPLAGADPK